LSAIKEINNLVLRFHKKSFLSAKAENIVRTGDTIQVSFNAGEEFKWVSLSPGNVNENLLNRSGYKEKFFRNTLFNYEEFLRLEENLLRYSDTHGYPFAAVSLDSLNITPGKISAALNYKSGPVISFDTLAVSGKTRIKRNFLEKYLRIFPGDLFDQSKIDNVNKLLRELPYIRQTRPYSLYFQNGKALLQLYLEDRRSNQIDGIVGFLPNESNRKKLLITGELNLNLKNLCGTGKTLGAQWKKFNLSSQTLDLMYFHPKLLGSNIDVQLDFNLLKQDSSFINVSRRMILSQRTGKYGRINFFTGLKTSRELLSNQLTDKSLLPPFSNYDFLTYGLGYEWNNLDDIFYPHSGWQLSSRALIGNKIIHKLTGFDDSLYNDIQLKSVQLNLDFLAERFFKVGKRSVIVIKSEGGTILNRNKNIFYNDMYRLGGLKSLRGFNENNFFATSFLTGTLEYRFFTDETSYLFLFYDQGYILNRLNKAIPKDYPYGFGAGISFTTGVGIFNFVYSLGQSKSQLISLNLSKIHFGIISRF
jgi:outer membrane protein assembly factor BamA